MQRESSGRPGRWAAAVIAPVVLTTGSVLPAAPTHDVPARVPITVVAGRAAPVSARIEPAATESSTGPAHVVVVVLENRSYRKIMAGTKAPYLARLARKGASYTRSYATTHPSQPNYFVLFAGSTLGITDNSCPHSFDLPNLAGRLRDAGRSFAGYAESLPKAGWQGCEKGPYARKHVPWVSFPGLPADTNLPFSAFPTDYASLPTVSFVIPNLDHDMHDGSIRRSDRWIRDNLGAYARWARRHDGLLIVTFDEDDGTTRRNRIPTIAYGQHVRPGRHGTHIDHCRVLRTLESYSGLMPLGCAAGVAPIRSMWRPAA